MDKFSSSEIEIVRSYLATTLSKQKRITVSDTFAALKDKFGPVDQPVFGRVLSAAIKDGKLSGLKIGRGRYGGIRLDDGSVEEQEVIPAPLGPKPPAIIFVTPRTKPLAEVTASDIPRGMSAEDVANDLPGVNDASEIEASVPIVEEPKRILAPAKTTPSWIVPKETKKLDLWIKDQHYRIPHSFSDVSSLLTNVLEAKEDAEGSIKFNEMNYACPESSLAFLDKFLFYFYGASQAVDENKV